MRKLFFSIAVVLLPMAMPMAQAAVPYQLPDITICNEKSVCAIAIDSDGYLRDLASRKKIFDQPFNQTVFDSYLVIKSGEHYVVERSNTTSSRNWDLLLFTYIGGSARAERAISLSKGFSMDSPKVYWSGYECRGGAIMERKYAPFDAAKRALCGGERQSDSLSLAKDAVIEAAKSQGLVVNIPVYGRASKQNVIYFFPGSDEPDAGSLLCLQRCKSESVAFGRYGGWIDKSLWIDGILHNSENLGDLTGSYVYIGKKERINLVGSYLNGKLHLVESFSDGTGAAQEKATFEGSGSKDAFVGKWYSLATGRTRNFFIASRIY
ncbi:hypothetical protein [Paraburkholderia terricola]|uniref:hypothetical protein n=1 Tax=Paraburkholderia terricola TaxID=169427 RepID=UPI002856449F|nr:hypothetical protein [Paraburkholderia terricola]MDR6482002.1 hypothetical protein [Paraburkholderia terricola]